MDEALMRSRRAEFIRALAEFLAGTNQVRMSLALQVGRGELFDIARMWETMRAVGPLRGYPTADEAAMALAEFLAAPIDVGRAR